MGVVFIRRCRHHPTNGQIPPKHHIYRQKNKPVRKMMPKRASSLRRLLNQILSQEKNSKLSRSGDGNKCGVWGSFCHPHRISQVKEYEYLIVDNADGGSSGLGKALFPLRNLSVGKVLVLFSCLLIFQARGYIYGSLFHICFLPVYLLSLELRH